MEFDSAGNTGTLSDLWVLNQASSEWAWMGGSGTFGSGNCTSMGFCGLPGLYGTLGAPATGNEPGSRNGAVSWTDNGGSFWLFGGNGVDVLLNDLWKYQPSASTLPAAVTPNFSPAAGTYTTAQNVTISNGMTNATIYFTTDGSMPTASSAVYGGPVTVSATETIEAIAMASGYPNSGVGTAAYRITPLAATPAFSLAAGTYSSPQTVTMSDATPGATIYYTTDGTMPTTSSTVYSGAVTVSATETIQAIAVAGGFETSAVASAAYSLPVSFTFTASSATLTIQSGQQGTVTLTVTPENGFNGPVAFGCAGLPTGGTCTFSPTTVTPAGAAVTTTLTISAGTQSAALRRGSGPLLPETALALATCVLVCRKRWRLQLASWFALAFVGVGLVSGCGSSKPKVLPVSTTITVSATSGAVLQKTDVLLTVN